MNGFLITFEGIDFSGKSIQANLLKEQLLAQNLPVIILREPGGTEISEKVREVLLDSQHDKMCAKTELLLYSAARAQMVQECVIQHLQKDCIVICDRYFDSTTAYQGYGRKIDLDFIDKLHNFVTQGIKPHLTFLIDLEPKETLARKKVSKIIMDRLEQENLQFHQRVREGYLKIARTESYRFIIIDGLQSIDEIAAQIFNHTKSRLNIR